MVKKSISNGMHVESKLHGNALTKKKEGDTL